MLIMADDGESGEKWWRRASFCVRWKMLADGGEAKHVSVDSLVNNLDDGCMVDDMVASST